MNTGIRRYSSAALITASVLLVSAGAFAVSQPVVVNTAEGVALTNPGSVEFTFVRHISDGSLATAMERIQTFIEAAPTAIRGADLQPTEITTAPPIITAFMQRQVRATVTVRFSMAVFNTAKTGPAQFAALCDKVTALASTMNATLSDPVFYAADPDSVIERAVARATENAYPAAEAVASVVRSNIYAVDKVEVLEVTWEQQPEGQTTDVPQIGCRAKVQVTYALAPQ